MSQIGYLGPTFHSIAYIIHFIQAFIYIVCRYACIVILHIYTVLFGMDLFTDVGHMVLMT